MNNQKFNRDKVVSIRTYDKYPVQFVEYREYRKGNWFRDEQQEGFYNTILDEPFPVTEEYIIKDGIESKLFFVDGSTEYIIKDRVMYEKPKLKVTFVDGSALIIRHDTLEDANSHMNDLINKNNINILKL